jgi:AcrR family transcriptional regulator
MSPPIGPALTAARGASHSEDARTRLLDAGLRLFSAQGFAKTSTRELAEAASVNIASISYYFGDKAGLYRAVFFEPLNGSGGSPAEDIARFSDPGLTLAQALREFYGCFLEPLKEGDRARLSIKLHFREMLEPTGLWDEEIDTGIAPMHHALVARLGRHLGVPEPDVAGDADLVRLAICLAGLAVHLHVGADINERLAPGLLAGPEGIDAWAERLTLFGLAMVRAEAERRGRRPNPKTTGAMA